MDRLGLPTPPELLFLDWIKDATELVKAKYPDATLHRAEAQKLPGSKANLYLANTAKFCVQKDQMVTVSGEPDRISEIDTIPLGYGDVKDLTQVKVSPWDILADQGDTDIQGYGSFALLQPVSSTSPSGQPYYVFHDRSNACIAVVGAQDGKIYSDLPK